MTGLESALIMSVTFLGGNVVGVLIGNTSKISSSLCKVKHDGINGRLKRIEDKIDKIPIPKET